MSVQSLKPATPVQWPAECLEDLPGALVQLRHWAQVAPLHNALRHVRDGQWYAWRWIDVLRDVECLADELRQQGFGVQSRLALCGAFEPHMVLLALAAQVVGGQTVTLTDELAPGRLHQQLWRLRPSHAYMPGVWLPGEGVPFTRMLPLRDPAPRLAHWWQALDSSPLWSVEGTGWQGGLTAVLQQWLQSGQGLAFAQPGGVQLRHAWRFSLVRTLQRARRARVLYGILAALTGVTFIWVNSKGLFS
ncbi:MAG: 2-succinylbenzoate--CoA ligase [Pseudomonas sp.]|nr:MAG: 2-succinylbenzoate--CoA ligase [Pseudomonas sp.]